MYQAFNQRSSKSEEHFLASDLLVPCPVLYLKNAKNILAQSYGHSTLLKGIPSRYIYIIYIYMIIYIIIYIHDLQSQLLDNVGSAPPITFPETQTKISLKKPHPLPIQSNPSIPPHLRIHFCIIENPTTPGLIFRDPLVRQKVSTNGSEKIWKHV